MYIFNELIVDFSAKIQSYIKTKSEFKQSYVFVRTYNYVSWDKFCYLIVDAHIENVSSPVGNSYIFYFIKRMAMRKNVCTYICVSQHINIVFLIMSGIKSTFAPPLLIKIYFFSKNL